MRIAAVASAVFAVLAVTSQAPQPPRAEVPQAVAQDLRRAIDAWASVPGHHGVSASMVLANGAQWSGAAGQSASDEPLTAEHLIQIASITKTMTGAVILQLADDGVLRLDDSLERWLPERANIDPGITIRQLLNHTNGLANYTLNAALGSAINADLAHVFTPAELLAFVGPRRFAAGTDTEYTNTAFLLLGQVAERATERSIVDLYHQRLWAPLDLSGVFLPGLEPAPGLVASALGSAGLVAPLERLSLLSVGHSAFGLMATASAVATWGHALFTGRVISDAMQAEMRTLVPAAGNIPGETGAGLGIRSYAYLGRTQFGHSGGAALGSSLLLHDPETGATVVVLMNQGQGAGHFVLAPSLLDIATRQ